MVTDNTVEDATTSPEMLSWHSGSQAQTKKRLTGLMGQMSTEVPDSW